MQSGWAGEWRELVCRVRNKWKRMEFVGESGLSGREGGHDRVKNDQVRLW